MLGYSLNTKNTEVIYLGADILKTKKGEFYKLHFLDKSSKKVTPMEFLTSHIDLYNKVIQFQQLEKVILLLKIEKVNYKVLDGAGNTKDKQVYATYLQDVEKAE